MSTITVENAKVTLAAAKAALRDAYLSGDTGKVRRLRAATRKLDLMIKAADPAYTGPEGWAGYRAHTRRTTTGGLVVLVDAVEHGIADEPCPTAWDGATGLVTAFAEPERWALICDRHAAICTWDQQRNARAHMDDPTEWCEECRDQA